jgi:hypothetical protein
MSRPYGLIRSGQEKEKDSRRNATHYHQAAPGRKNFTDSNDKGSQTVFHGNASWCITVRTGRPRFLAALPVEKNGGNQAKITRKHKEHRDFAKMRSSDADG